MKRLYIIVLKVALCKKAMNILPAFYVCVLYSFDLFTATSKLANIH